MSRTRSRTEPDRGYVVFTQECCTCIPTLKVCVLPECDFALQSVIATSWWKLLVQSNFTYSEVRIQCSIPEQWHILICTRAFHIPLPTYWYLYLPSMTLFVEVTQDSPCSTMMFSLGLVFSFSHLVIFLFLIWLFPPLHAGIFVPHLHTCELVFHPERSMARIEKKENRTVASPNSN